MKPLQYNPISAEKKNYAGKLSVESNFSSKTADICCVLQQIFSFFLRTCIVLIFEKQKKAHF